MSASLSTKVDNILNDPKYHDVLSIIKGVRNGVVYGIKVRFLHAVIIATVFQSGSFKDRVRYVFRATRQHCLNLAQFVGIYKTTMILQKHLLHNGKSKPSDAFFSGVLGGWIMFGTRNAINEQIVMYLISRIFMSYMPREPSKLPSKSLPKPTSDVAPATPIDPSVAPQPPRPIPVSGKAFEWLAALSWGAIMYLFAQRPQDLQGGLVSSMQYLYVDSDYWSTLKNFIWHNK